jgi:hypothetical protein
MLFFFFEDLAEQVQRKIIYYIYFILSYNGGNEKQ